MVKIAKKLAESITEKLEKNKPLDWEDRTLLVACIKAMEKV